VRSSSGRTTRTTRPISSSAGMGTSSRRMIIARRGSLCEYTPASCLRCLDLWDSVASTRSHQMRWRTKIARWGSVYRHSCCMYYTLYNGRTSFVILLRISQFWISADMLLMLQWGGKKSEREIGEKIVNVTNKVICLPCGSHRLPQSSHVFGRPCSVPSSGDSAILCSHLDTKGTIR
jgi:hypothetical protein